MQWQQENHSLRFSLKSSPIKENENHEENVSSDDSSFMHSISMKIKWMTSNLFTKCIIEMDLTSQNFNVIEYIRLVVNKIGVH